MDTVTASNTPRKPAGSSGAATLTIVLVVLAIGLVAWGLFSRHSAEAKLKTQTEAQVAVPVSVIQPKPSNTSNELILPGNVQALVEAPIYARTTGYVKRWLVDIGQPVKAGQLLAELDTPEVDEQLNQAEADLANVKANNQIAKVTADRWKDLRASDSVSKQDADERISAASASDAAVKASAANLQRLRELTGFKNIVAPFDGIVTARNTDVGQLVNAGNTQGRELFRVADVSKLRVYVRVPQNYAAGIQPGMTAELRFPDRPGKTYTAQLAGNAGALDDVSRTLLVQLEVGNASKELLPGAYAEVHFKLVSGGGTTLLLPANTLLFRADGLRVATVTPDNTIELKNVTLIRDLGSQIEIGQGITAQDQVVMSPPDSATDGLQVKIMVPADDKKPAEPGKDGGNKDDKAAKPQGQA